MIAQEHHFVTDCNFLYIHSLLACYQLISSLINWLRIPPNEEEIPLKENKLSNSLLTD